MKGLEEEIREIPQRARECYEKNRGVRLPEGAPYLGMGSSYFAPLTLFYCGAKINPQIASEYYYYLGAAKQPLAVLISQSGESSETVWCLEKFDRVTAVTNAKKSSLSTAKNCERNIEIHAGSEKFSSTKSYINTLITLYLGLQIDPCAGVECLVDKFDELGQAAKKEAEKIARYLGGRKVNGLYVIGSGPNIGTACEGALTLSETTKLAWLGLPVAQYDHGPKETANDTVVVILNGGGHAARRIAALKKILNGTSNALTVELGGPGLPEALTPLPLAAQLNLLMNELADLLKVGDTFLLGSKVTTIKDEAK